MKWRNGDENCENIVVDRDSGENEKVNFQNIEHVHKFCTLGVVRQ